MCLWIAVTVTVTTGASWRKPRFVTRINYGASVAVIVKRGTLNLTLAPMAGVKLLVVVVVGVVVVLVVLVVLVVVVVVVVWGFISKCGCVDLGGGRILQSLRISGFVRLKDCCLTKAVWVSRPNNPRLGQYIGTGGIGAWDNGTWGNGAGSVFVPFRRM